MRHNKCKRKIAHNQAITHIHDVSALETCPHLAAPFLCTEIVFVLVWTSLSPDYAPWYHPLLIPQ